MDRQRHGRSLAFVILLILPFAGYSQNLQLADSLHQRGMIFYKSGSYKQAEFYLREAFKLYETYSPKTVQLSPGIDYAEILTDRSKYRQALQLFAELKKNAIAKNKISAQARIENSLGWIYNIIGKNKAALTHLKKAIPLAEQARDTLRLGYIYNNIGSVHFSRGAYNRSLKYRKRSLYYLKKINNQSSLSVALNNIGLTYKKLLLYDEALEYYQQSLKIQQALGNIDLLATTQSNIGMLQNQLGNLNQALVHYQKSLAYSRKSGNSAKTARTINNIGALYDELGQPERALQYYRQSLQLKKKFSNPASRATSYKNIASRLWDFGRRDEAIAYYKKALALKKEVGNPHTIARSLLDLVMINKAQGQFPDAFAYVNQVQAIADSTRDPSLLKEAAYWRGILYYSQDNFFDAIRQYKRALNYSRSLASDEQLPPLMKLASAYNRMHSDSALYYGRQAINIIEKGRSRVGSLSQFKTDYFSQYSDFYIDMASWLLKYHQNISRAYHFAELAKARSLMDELVKASLQIDKSLPEKERLNRGQKLSAISDLYASLKSTADIPRKKSLLDKIREKELNYAAYEHNLHEKYPQYKQLASPHPVSLSQTQQMCDSKTAVLEYAVTDNKLLIFFITTANIRTKQFNLKQHHLASAVSQFRQAIVSKTAEDSIAALAKPLYQTLIAPFEKGLKGYSNLVIIPDSYLAYLPFSALKKDNNYLVSQFNIKYAPSITGLSLIHAPRSYPVKKVLAIGNSAAYSIDSNKPLLPSLGLEVATVSQIFKNTTLLEDRNVTEANVKAQMKRKYAIIHIAAHSVIDEQNSFMSGIVLSQMNHKSRGVNDGYLRSSEIYRLSIPSNLVVLSACKSGVGNVVKGEGMLGLERAFFNAGASTVVVSLWDVYDRSTTRFMKDFYKSLKQKDSNTSWSETWTAMLRKVGWNKSLPFGHTASATRAAKLKMLHSPSYHHPVYWAPFIVVGR